MKAAPNELRGRETITADGAAGTAFSATEVLHQVALSKATELARASRYLEAEQLLSEITREQGETPASLDLLARIHAQQGKLREAEALWTRACELVSANEAYQAALRRIAKIYSRPAGWSSMLPLLIGVAVVICTVIAGFTFKGYLDDFRALLFADVESSLSSAVVKITAGQAAATERLTENIKSDISDLRVSVGSAIAKPAMEREPVAARVSRGVPPEVKVEVPGVSIEKEGAEVIIIFDSGLFSSGVDLTPNAKVTLTTLGRQFEPYVDHITVRVAGHTDDRPVFPLSRYRDNVALGMARALMVIEHVTKTTALPFTLFSASSFGEFLTPYPNDTPDNRARNRTVVLRISNSIQ